MVETKVTKHSVATERVAAEEEATKGPAACVAPRNAGCRKGGGELVAAPWGPVSCSAGLRTHQGCSSPLIRSGVRISEEEASGAGGVGVRRTFLMGR